MINDNEGIDMDEKGINEWNNEYYNEGIVTSPTREEEEAKGKGREQNGHGAARRDVDPENMSGNVGRVNGPLWR